MTAYAIVGVALAVLILGQMDDCDWRPDHVTWTCLTLLSFVGFIWFVL